MSFEDLDALDAPPAHRLAAVTASNRTPVPTRRRDDDPTITLEPTDDDPSNAPSVPTWHARTGSIGPVGPVAPVTTDRPAEAPSVATAARSTTPTVRVVDVPTSEGRGESTMYLAMGLGIACTVAALAMLLVSWS